MSDSEDIYDAPAAPVLAQSGKVSQLARAFESCLRQPIMPQYDAKQLPPKTKPKMVIAPSAVGKLPDMGLARDKLRPVSVANKQQPDVTQSDNDQSEPRAGNEDSRVYSLRKHSARESMFPPEVGSAAAGGYFRRSQGPSGGDASPVIRTSCGSFRMVALPSLDGAAAPDKPDIIDVDLEQFRRLTAAVYQDTPDDIYDDIAADGPSDDSFVSTSVRRSDVTRPDSRVVSAIPDMTEEEERDVTVSRGTVFETIDSEEEEEAGAEQEYDDIMHQDGEIYQDIK